MAGAAMNIGYQEVTGDSAQDDLRHRLNASPAGRQLAIDGNFLFSVVTNDPATSVEIPPDGTPVLYNRSGTLELWVFTRETGWQQI